MNSQKLVSIIIPTFNRANTLGQAIQSALNQTYKNTQIIVIDDGSTDDTADIVRVFSGIEYYYQDNRGQAAARNAGLFYARGELIASLDSDDVWNPRFLEKCAWRLIEDDLDIVFANWKQEMKDAESWSFLANDPFLKPYLSRESEGWIKLNYDEARDLYVRSCPSPSSSVVVKKASIVSGWDEKMNIGDDWSMYLEMILSKECKIAFTMEELWKKRVDNINVYDGRKWSEVLELLYIADLGRNMVKFRDLLTPDEMNIFRKRYMNSLVELSKHKLIRDFDIISASKLLFTSFHVNVPYTMKAIPNIFLLGLGRKIATLKKKN